jgi:TIR domain
MAIATLEDLRYTARWDSADRVKLAKSIDGKNVFLSHSQSDLRPAEFAVDILEQHGASVYIDVRDAVVASASSDREIAMRLRKAIQQTRRLAVLVTENTSTSRWIPWEMGVADGIGGPGRVALFPFRRDANAPSLWAEQEYFELYARVESLSYPPGSPPQWIVRVPNGTPSGKVQPLGLWLTNSRPF